MLTITILQLGTPDMNYRAMPAFSSFVETTKQVELLVKTAKQGKGTGEVFLLDNPGLSRELIEELKALTPKQATVTVVTDVKQMEEPWDAK